MTSRWIGAALCVWLAATAAAAPAAGGQQRGSTPPWDVRDQRPGQFAIYNPDSDGSALGMPCAAADLDGDGTDDAVLAPFLAPSGATNGRSRAGELRVVFGRPGDLSGSVVAGDVVVWGARSGDMLGNEVDAGDVTGDGLADILACAQNADGFGTNGDRPGAGALYVVRGRAEWPETIDLAAEPEGVTQILGADPNERCGFWATAGDVTGDGVKDILVSADLALGRNGQGRRAGRLYVIPGRADLPARIDLADADQLEELGIVTVYGIDDCDHLGSCIVAADFDADGVEDVAVSAGVSRAGASVAAKQANCGRGSGGGDGPANDRPDTGEVYVLYGRENWPAHVELSNPPADVAIYYGQNPGDHFGEDVRAGDFDGDGRPELAVGALTAAAPSGTPGQPSRSRAGVGYIFWGALLERGERVDLRSLNTSSPRVTRIYGERAGDIGADTVALVDVDNDGLAEMVFASPLFDPAGRPEAGDLKLVFGSRGRLPGVVDLASPPATVDVFRIVAADPGDMFAYSFTHGDFDGDGYRDLMPNAMGGDGSGNCCRDAGELYVISGRAFSDYAGRSPAGAPCLTRVTVTPAASRYFAGQTGIELRLECTGGEGGFVEGAVALVNGVEVPTTFVDASTLVVRLDDAPEVRNAPGPVTVAARNPGGPASAALEALVLEGPEITRVKAKRKGQRVRLNVKGADFLPGATVVVETEDGSPVEVTSAVRKSTKKIQAFVAAADAPPGARLVVRVANPGPALSAPAEVTVP